MNAEIDGDRLSEEEVIANCIVTMVGGQETTTNLIGNGVLTLLRNPDELEKLRSDLSLIPSAVEELLRYESPSQHTARLAPEDTVLGGKQIRKRQAVIAVMAAANRDPERFPIPTGSTSRAKTTGIWPLAGRRISVLGRRWRGSKVRSPSKASCAACPTWSLSPARLPGGTIWV